MTSFRNYIRKKDFEKISFSKFCCFCLNTSNLGRKLSLASIQKLQRQIKEYESSNQPYSVSQTLTIIDILLFCYYSLNISNDKSNRNDVSAKKISTYLQWYDYNYVDLEHARIRNEIKQLFPKKRNLRKRKKILTINNTMLFYWGGKLNINFGQHNEIYSIFKRYAENVNAY